MNSGNSAIIPPGGIGKGSGYLQAGNGGGNSGCVISPAPGLGLSSYQNPDISVKEVKEDAH